MYDDPGDRIEAMGLSRETDLSHSDRPERWRQREFEDRAEEEFSLNKDTHMTLIQVKEGTELSFGRVIGVWDLPEVI